MWHYKRFGTVSDDTIRDIHCTVVRKIIYFFNPHPSHPPLGAKVINGSPHTITLSTFSSQHLKRLWGAHLMRVNKQLKVNKQLTLKQHVWASNGSLEFSEWLSDRMTRRILDRPPDRGGAKYIKSKFSNWENETYSIFHQTEPSSTVLGRRSTDKTKPVATRTTQRDQHGQKSETAKQLIFRECHYSGDCL